jgi:hypothetical protein
MNSANFAFWGFCEVRIHGVLGSCVWFLRRVDYVAHVALGRESSSKTKRDVGKYGKGARGVFREVLQQLWAGAATGRPLLLELRQTGPPRGARTNTGGRCSCSPAPTGPTLRASAIQHQGDSGFGGRRGRVRAPNVTLGRTTWDALLRGTYPHDGGCGLIYHQSVSQRSCGRWQKAGSSWDTNGPLAVR